MLRRPATSPAAPSDKDHEVSLFQSTEQLSLPNVSTRGDFTKSNAGSPRSGVPFSRPAWDLTFWHWHMKQEALKNPVRYRSVSQGAPSIVAIETVYISTMDVAGGQHPPPAKGEADTSDSGADEPPKAFKGGELSNSQLRHWVKNALSRAKEDTKLGRRSFRQTRGSHVEQHVPLVPFPPGSRAHSASGADSMRGSFHAGVGSRNTASFRGSVVLGSTPALRSPSHGPPDLNASLRRFTPPEFLECQRFLGKIDFAALRKASVADKNSVAAAAAAGGRIASGEGGVADGERRSSNTGRNSLQTLQPHRLSVGGRAGNPHADEPPRRSSQVSAATAESKSSSSSTASDDDSRRRSSDASATFNIHGKEMMRGPSSGIRGGDASPFKRSYMVERRETFNKRVSTAFARLSSSNEITTDELQKALELMGNSRINLEWIDDICKTFCSDRYCLSCDEFSQVASTYEGKHWSYLEDIFREADQFGSDSLSYTELKQILGKTAAAPMPRAVREQIKELFGYTVSKCTVSLDQFMRLHDVLASRFGFTNRDYELLTRVFKQHDADVNGILDVAELRVAFSKSYVGPDAVSSLCAEAIAGGKHEVDLTYFLAVVRRHREDEILRITRAFQVIDAKEEGFLTDRQVAQVFHELGEDDVSPEKVRAAAKVHKLHKKDVFDFEETCLVWQAWQETHGIPKGELADVEAAFQRADADNSGGIDRSELGGIIRWLGYPSTYELEVELLEEFRQETSSELNFSEVLTLMKKYQAMEARQVRKSFEKRAKADASARLPVAELRNMLLRMGHVPTHEQVHKLEAKAGGKDALASMWEFSRLVVLYRQEARKKLQKNQGFSDRQVNQFRGHFQSYDPSRTGFIVKSAVQSLLKELFEDVAENENTQRRATQLFKQVDENRDGRLDFNEYLQMMRLYQDQADNERFTKESAVAEECGFTRAELKDYRQLFQMFDSDASGELSREECLGMFAPLLPEGRHATEDLHQVLNKVDEDGNRELNFAEFLRMMHTLKEAPMSQSIFGSTAPALKAYDSLRTDSSSLH
mmetsp:Transcript_32457/g.76245  ORF Transcript_32457/g.76245 Transcript_32457/m.76245 type:complete len:1044 (-) Transcript_32457:24-3155(-)